MSYRTIPKQTYCSKRDGTMKKDLKKMLAIPCDVWYNRVYPKDKGCENWQLNISHLDYWNLDGAWNGNRIGC